MKSFREMIDEYFDDHPEGKKAISSLDIDRWLAKNADEMVDKFANQLAQDLDSKQREFAKETLHKYRARYFSEEEMAAMI